MLMMPRISHVHVVPMVHAGAEDDHGAAVRLLGVAANSPGDSDDVVARHAGDALGPGRGVGLQIVVGPGEMLAA